MTKKQNGVSRPRKTKKTKSKPEASLATVKAEADHSAAILEALLSTAGPRGDILRGIFIKNMDAFMSFLTTAAAAIDPETRLNSAIGHIRDIVNEDSTHPIAAKYIGRSLHESGAFSAEQALSRPDIFAFFNRPEPSAVLTDAKYRNVAEGCVTVVGGVHRRAKTEVANCASQALEKPIKKLEEWMCIRSVRDKNGKRVASYLVNLSDLVFNGWETWPEFRRPRSARGPSRLGKLSS